LVNIDILKSSIDVVKWPTSRALELGGLIMRMSSRQHIVDRLKIEEPKSRATIAIKSAKSALDHEEPDTDLGVVEILRASRAIERIAKEDLEMAKEIAPEIVYLAIELPDNKNEIEVAERVTGESLKQLVDSVNDEKNNVIAMRRG
jgi:hypothetical protein